MERTFPSWDFSILRYRPTEVKNINQSSKGKAMLIINLISHMWQEKKKTVEFESQQTGSNFSSW